MAMLLLKQLLFENDVKQYGTQASALHIQYDDMFENDVKQYGTQANHTERIAMK